VVHVDVILSTITVSGFTEEWFMLVLYYIPLFFKVLQRSGSCCCCYIVYHYCSRFDRGVVHVVVVILSTITVYGLTEEWFMLL
jgi:sugar phosphate permease